MFRSQKCLSAVGTINNEPLVYTHFVYFSAKVNKILKQRQEECFFVDTDACNCNQRVLAPCVTHAYGDNGRWTKQTLGVCAYLAFPLATSLTPTLSYMLRGWERMSQWLVRGLSHTC